MDKKSASKVMMFFEGLTARAEENRDFFSDISVSLKSGTKMFPMRIDMPDDKFSADYLAVKRVLDARELNELMRAELSKYDEVTVVYRERGTQITIKGDRKNVRLSQEDAAVKTAEENAVSQVGGGREYVVNPALAGELLGEIGILAKNGKIKNDKIRKYNQIDYFVELMKGVLDETAPGDEELVILDCACGKSYLSFVLNFYLRDILKRRCRFIGVDYSQTVIDASRRIAKKLGYNNMEFIRADLKEYVPEAKPAAVISLHACDTATDMALALGIKTGAGAIVSVPCCHKDILKQYSYEPFAAVTKHGILKARLADTLTDALRSAYLEGEGYKVSMIEYISPLETPKNIMIRAVKKGHKNPAAMEEYERLKRIIHVEPAIERFLKRDTKLISSKWE